MKIKLYPDLANELIQWSKNNYSALPWRKKRTLYKTLVSEIMLQQTTVGTVINHFDRFLDLYPDLASLAQASEEDIVVAWKGLGYYRRAKNLLKAAKYIMDLPRQTFPQEKKELMLIPGIGDYTSSALVAIGRDRAELAIDANLIRVFSRFYYLKNSSRTQTINLLREKFLLEPEGRNFFQIVSVRGLNEALMDLGREVCKANIVRCESCVLKSKCGSFKKKDFLIEQVKENKIEKFYSLDLVRYIQFNAKKNKILAQEKSPSEWLSGQFELPTFILNSEDKNLKQYPMLNKKDLEESKKLFEMKSGITKYKISNKVVQGQVEQNKQRASKLTYLSLDDRRWSSFSVKVLKKLTEQV